MNPQAAANRAVRRGESVGSSGGVKAGSFAARRRKGRWIGDDRVAIKRRGARQAGWPIRTAARQVSICCRNWRALSRQVKRSECSRAFSRGIRERGETGRAEIVAERAGAAFADHVERPGDRIGGDRHAARQRLDQHDAEGVGPRREDEHVGAGVDPRQRFAVQRAEEMRVREAPLEAGARRPVADDDHRARQLELQQRLEVLLHRDATDAEEDRPRQVERVGRARPIEAVVDAARPHLDLFEAAARQLVADRQGRRQRRRGGRVEAAQRLVGDRLGQAGARGDIFGKARVIAGGEQAPALAAVAARRPADRALGGDVDVVGAGGVDAPRNLPRRSEREADVGVGRQRQGGEALRRQEDELGVELARRRRHALERMDDAVDLRPPGVGGDEDPDQAASASASTSASSATGAARPAICSRSRRAAANVFDHRITSSLPSSCSTTSEQDSTKSPVLT